MATLLWVQSLALWLTIVNLWLMTISSEREHMFWSCLNLNDPADTLIPQKWASHRTLRLIHFKSFQLPVDCLVHKRHFTNNFWVNEWIHNSNNNLSLNFLSSMWSQAFSGNWIFLCIVLGITHFLGAVVDAPIAVRRLAGERMVPTVADT